MSDTTTADHKHSAWQLPHFRLFLFARAVSWVGNAITLVALPVLIFQMTGSPALTGLITVLSVAPYLVFGLPAGALADRWNRKYVLIVTGVLSGLVLSTIPLASWLSVLTVPHVLIAAGTLSSLYVFFDAASFGAVPELVGRERIPSATGAMVSVSTLITLIGPAFGGLLAATISPTWAIGIDAIAYLVAAALTACVTWPKGTEADEAAPDKQSLVKDIAEGLAYIWNQRVIRLLTIIGATASFAAGSVTGLLVVAGVQHLGLSDDDSRMGLLYSATALGAFLSSMLIARIQKRVPTGWIAIAALSIAWAAQIVWSFTGSLILAIAILTLFQAASTLLIMNGIIVRQSLAPNRLQSRVNTTARMIAWGGTPLGAGLGGLLAQHIDLTTALLVCSIGTGISLTLALASRLWRIPTLERLREANPQNGDGVRLN